VKIQSLSGERNEIDIRGSETDLEESIHEISKEVIKPRMPSLPYKMVKMASIRFTTGKREGLLKITTKLRSISDKFSPNVQSTATLTETPHALPLKKSMKINYDRIPFRAESKKFALEETAKLINDRPSVVNAGLIKLNDQLNDVVSERKRTIGNSNCKKVSKFQRKQSPYKGNIRNVKNQLINQLSYMKLKKQIMQSKFIVESAQNKLAKSKASTTSRNSLLIQVINNHRM
jgi:hypothetical protein